MYVCLCVRVFFGRCVDVKVGACVCVICWCLHMCVLNFVYIYVCLSVRVYERICVWACVCVHVSVCAFVSVCE
jgi:hypothetical protein